MNNVELCNGKSYSLQELWNKRVKVGLRADPQFKMLSSGYQCPELTQLVWACAYADSALMFDIGDLVTYKDGETDHHAVVDSYVTNHYMPVESTGCYVCYDKLVVLLADGRKVTLDAYKLKKSDIPKEIIDLVKSRIVETLQCPLAARAEKKEVM